MKGTASVRFWAKVDKGGPVPAHRPDLGSCWVWTAGLEGSGYGLFWADGRHVGAHRWAFIDAHGPIPDQLQTDHLCRVRRCVRPSHLELVTGLVNTQRGRAGALERERTHCPNEHPYDAANTYQYPDGRRGCRVCMRDARRAWAKANPEKEKERRTRRRRVSA